MEEHNELFQQFTDDPLFLKQITDSGPAITYVLDLEKNDFIYINISANDLSGNDKSYFFMQGRNIFREIVHPNDYERTMHYIQLLAKEDHVPAVLEARLKIKDNYYRWFRFSDYIFKRNEYGRPSRSIGVAQDIHEAKLATQESERLNNWFNSVLENSPNGVTALRAVRDRNGVITDLEYIFANRVALEAISKGELEGTLFCKDLPSLKAIGLFDKYVSVIESGIPWEDEVSYNNEEGVEAWLHVSVSKLDDGCIACFFDVTERKKIEQQITRQERQYHSLVENTPDVISRWDKNLKLIFTNTAAEIKTGVQRETLYGKTNVEMGHPEEIARPWMEKLREVFETGRSISYESPFYTPHGIADFLYRIVPEKNSNGEVETVLAIARDITEIKKNERAIREGAELLNGIMNAPNVGIAVFKTIRNNDGLAEDFQCEFVNRRTREAMGIDPAGIRLSEYGKDGIEQLKYLKEAVETGQKITYTLNAESGLGGWFILSVAPLGKDRVVQSWEDINEIKRRDQEVIALKEELAERAQDKYKTLFSSINEGFCILEKVEGDGPVDFQFIEANPAFELHTGTPAEDVIGKTIRQAFPQESEEWFQIYDNIVRTGNDRKFERGMDSQDRMLELYAFRVNDETGRRVAIVFRDITERKKAELKLKEAKELMENIAGTIPDMISVQEYPSRKIIYFNRDAYRLNGLDIDKMKKMTVEERHALIHPDDEPGLRKHVESLAGLSNESVATHEYRTKNMTNDWMWVRVRSKVFERNDQGKVISIVNVIHNVTAQKEAERKVREGHDLLQSVIDSSLSIIRVMKAVRNEKGEIIDFRYVLKNNSIGSYTDSDRIGKLFSDIHPELIGSDLFKSFKKVTEGGGRTEFESQLDVGRGELRWFRTVLVKLGDGIASASEDVTDRKRREINSALIAEIQDDLANARDEDEILQIAGSKIGRALNVACCLLVNVDEESDGASPQYLWRGEGIPNLKGEFHISDFFTDAGIQLLKSGKTIVVPDVDNNPLVKSAAHYSIQTHSSIKVPFRRDGKWKYVVVANDTKPRDWRADEVDLFQEFANRVSLRIERVRAEAILRQAEESLRSRLENKVQQHGEELKKTKELLQSVSDAANNLLAGFNIVYSSDGEVEDFELLMCNKVTASVIGQNSESLSGTRYSVMFPASMKNGGFERIREVARTGIPADFELWHSRLETDRWYRCTVSKLSNMIILNGKDITELKKIDADQQQSLELLRRAEALVKSLTNGSTIMHDEIQNIRDTIGATLDANSPQKNQSE